MRLFKRLCEDNTKNRGIEKLISLIEHIGIYTEVFDWLFISIFLIAAVIASYTDIRTREVPDWLNYGLIFVGLGTRAIYSLSEFDWSYILEGLLGLAVFFLFACFMFYTGQWGGGDAKLIMGIGALFGLRLDIFDFSVSFVVNIFLVGAMYALMWSIALAIKNHKAFFKELRKIIETPKMIIVRKIVLITSTVLFVAVFLITPINIRLMLLLFVILLLMTFYLWIAVRAVEKSCMLKLIDPSKLTEGDWIAKNIVIGGKRIAGPKDLGIDKSQIAELIKLKKKNKLKLVLIKEGIPFVPSFLLSFIATWIWGNLFLAIL